MSRTDAQRLEDILESCRRLQDIRALMGVAGVHHRLMNTVRYARRGGVERDHDPPVGYGAVLDLCEHHRLAGTPRTRQHAREPTRSRARRQAGSQRRQQTVPPHEMMRCLAEVGRERIAVRHPEAVLRHQSRQ